MSAKYAIGVDVGGTQIRAAVVNHQGEIIERVALPTPASEGPNAVLAQILKATQQLSKRANDMPIGVASPGPLDTKRGVTLGLPTMVGFDHFRFGDHLRETFGRKVLLTHDGMAAAVGEWKYGAARGCDDFVYVTVSTGIGGGVIAGGKILEGRKGMAAHVGHILIEMDGKLCNCGRKGCWEAYASGPAFEKRTRAKLRTKPHSTLNEASTAKEIFAAAAAGDAFANEMVDYEAQLLGVGIVSLLHAYDPALIVMGGGVSQNFERLKTGITQIIETTAMEAFRDIPLKRAHHLGDSGLLGAAAMAFENVL